MQFIYRQKNKIITIIIALLLMPFFFNIGLYGDEPFSMGMINHTYSSIASLTSLDIHPPLYYWVLKTFLLITTFWTKNIFIKIIFARLLSVIFSITTLVFLLKILKIFQIKNNLYLEILIFLLLPLEISLIPESITIRMYSLATMLFVIELYYLLKCSNNSSIKFLTLIYISITLSLYNNYFGGLISGLFLISVIINNIFLKKWKEMFELLIVGVASLISFSPWIGSIELQMSLVKNSKFQITFYLLQYLLEVFIIIFFFSLPYFTNHKSINKPCKSFYVMIVVILTIIGCIINVLRVDTANLRYLSPLIIPFTFVSFNILISKRKNNKKINLICGFILSLILIGGLCISTKRQYSRYFIPQFSFTKKFQDIKESKSTNINVAKYRLNDNNWIVFGGGAGGNAIYLKSIDKKISNKNYVNTYDFLGNGNEKLFKAIFPNIEHYSTKKTNK